MARSEAAERGPAAGAKLETLASAAEGAPGVSRPGVSRPGVSRPGVSRPGGSAPSRSGSRKSGSVKAATPWGRATVVEEVRVAQRAGERRFSSVVQLLRDDGGEPLVRIAYATGGVVRRGPVTLRLKDLERLRVAAERSSELAAALGWSGGDA
jgi:hypothetical protein